MRRRGSEPGCKKSGKTGGAHSKNGGAHGKNGGAHGKNGSAHSKNGGAHDASQLAVGRREGPQMDGYVYEKEEETSLERLAEVN